MMKKLSSLLIIIFLVFSIKSTACSYIEFTNDGPVTVDTPITFKVKNSYRTAAPSYEYRFSFEQFPQLNKVIVSTEDSIAHKVRFNSTLILSRYVYNVAVDVWYCIEGVPSHSIGTVHDIFKLSIWLEGRIMVDQSDAKFVSTASPVNLTVEIKDPNGYFDADKITYRWVVNATLNEESYDKVLSLHFSSPQENLIFVFVTAQTLNGSFQKFGSFDISLQSKDPIRNLTVDGHTNVELFRDQSLQLTIKIKGGTPPFHYCWEIVHTTSLGAICKYTNDSFFQVSRYFGEKGMKELILNVENDVSSINKNIEILSSSQ